MIYVSNGTIEIPPLVGNPIFMEVAKNAMNAHLIWLKSHYHHKKCAFHKCLGNVKQNIKIQRRKNKCHRVWTEPWLFLVIAAFFFFSLFLSFWETGTTSWIMWKSGYLSFVFEALPFLTIYWHFLSIYCSQAYFLPVPFCQEKKWNYRQRKVTGKGRCRTW